MSDHEFRAPLEWWEVEFSNGTRFDVRAMGFVRVGDNVELNSAAVGHPNNYLVRSAQIPANIVGDIHSNYGDRPSTFNRPARAATGGPSAHVAAR
jgi:hypothetical protein